MVKDDANTKNALYFLIFLKTCSSFCTYVS